MADRAHGVAMMVAQEALEMNVLFWRIFFAHPVCAVRNVIYSLRTTHGFWRKIQDAFLPERPEN